MNVTGGVGGIATTQAWHGKGNLGVAAVAYSLLSLRHEYPLEAELMPQAGGPPPPVGLLSGRPCNPSMVQVPASFPLSTLRVSPGDPTRSSPCVGTLRRPNVSSSIDPGLRGGFVQKKNMAQQIGSWGSRAEKKNRVAVYTFQLSVDCTAFEFPDRRATLVCEIKSVKEAHTKTLKPFNKT